jgi:predicted nuclease of predicted toxin-antitoxin system
MRFFADHCVPSEVPRTLLGEGHEVLLLRDHMPTDSADRDVIAMAQELDCVLLSLNGDFADIVGYPPADYGGIIAIHLRNHPEAMPGLMLRLVDYLVAQPARDYYWGKLLILEPHRVRVRS